MHRHVAHLMRALWHRVTGRWRRAPLPPLDPIVWSPMPISVLLDQVLQHMPGSAARGVCKEWRALTNQRVAKLVVRMPLDSFTPIASFKGLRTLGILQGWPADADIPCFPTLKTLICLCQTTADAVVLLSTQFPALEELTFGRCSLVGRWPALRSLHASLASPLDLDDFPSLQELDMGSATYPSLKGRSTTLTDLNCDFTQLDSLPPLPALRVLRCQFTPIASLDLALYPLLEELDCAHSDLTSLLGGSPLRVLDCEGTDLESLPPLPALRSLHCGDTPVAALDLALYPSLQDLWHPRRTTLVHRRKGVRCRRQGRPPV